MYGIYENGAVIARFVVPMYMRSNKPIFSSDALSLKRNVTARSTQRWELETRLEPLTVGANDLQALLVTADHHTPIQIIVPQNPGVIATRTSVSTPTGTGALGAASVTISANVGIIPRGSFIKFANHSKIYMTRNELDGNGALNIYPNLHMAITDEIVSHQDDVLMSCFVDLDTMIGMGFEDGILMDNGVVKLIEDLG